ncbi:alpha/beta-hydrolase [Triangularia verruculosa]|uniref:Alpha/beta-hydrolase n=1 Tax=Triangularia verruculosa TaxID=2587418 RepID=A0AAN6XD84_9PEZI|nr:alpha/beta-hydrolase [Triangularia verruculosa]
MRSTSPLVVASLLGAANAGVPKTCSDYRIPISITSNNAVFGLRPFKSDFDVAEFVTTIASHTPEISSSVLSPFTVNATETFTISATFCRPGHEKPDPKRENTVLIATHGLNFDRTHPDADRICVNRYWDPQLDKETYSFVDYVLNEGYSIFYYDRLGVGESEQVSGYVAQLSNQVTILTELTKLIKGGHYVGGTGRPSKTVLVGHSFGSAISSEVVRQNKKLVDGVVLTGFSYNSTHLNGLEFLEAAGVRIAAQQQPGKWRQLDTGYLTTVDLFASVTTFFHDGYYDTEVARYVDDHKVPFAVTELLTGHSFAIQPIDFTGAVMILSGKYDFPFCMSDCDGVLGNPGASIFSKAKAFKAISLPGTGHGINYHTTANQSFEKVTSFLAANGL